MSILILQKIDGKDFYWNKDSLRWTKKPGMGDKVFKGTSSWSSEYLYADIPEKRKNLIIRAYFVARNHSAWVARIQKVLDLDSLEVQYLESWDDYIQEHYESDYKWEEKIRLEMEMGILHLDTDEEILQELSQRIAECYADYYQRAISDEEPVIRFILMQMRHVDSMIRMRKVIQARIYHKQQFEYPDKREEYKWHGMIENARNYPMERLLDVNQHTHMTLCPFHDDKNPSCSIKNNFGYCFSCQISFDPIKLIMKTKSKTFAEAVNYLNNM